MTRTEIDALRAEYLTLVPADHIRGAFFSKEQLQSLLAKHDDTSGLFFYILPNPTGASKFTMVAEPFNPLKLPYPETESSDGEPTDRGLDGGMSQGFPCPPDETCPPGN